MKQMFNLYIYTLQKDDQNKINHQYKSLNFAPSLNNLKMVKAEKEFCTIILCKTVQKQTLLRIFSK